MFNDGLRQFARERVNKTSATLAQSQRIYNQLAHKKVFIFTASGKCGSHVDIINQFIPNPQTANKCNTKFETITNFHNFRSF